MPQVFEQSLFLFFFFCGETTNVGSTLAGGSPRSGSAAGAGWAPPQGGRGGRSRRRRWSGRSRCCWRRSGCGWPWSPVEFREAKVWKVGYIVVGLHFQLLKIIFKKIWYNLFSLSYVRTFFRALFASSQKNHFPEIFFKIWGF